MTIVYDEEDFHSKMKEFGAKLRQCDASMDYDAPRNGYGTNMSNVSRNRKQLMKSKANWRCTGCANHDPISTNIQSIQSKLKFSRLVVYSTNCLANISENRLSCDAIVEKGGIETLKQVISHHKLNPAAMKEASRTLINITKANPMYAQQISNHGVLDQCIDVLSSNAKETALFAIDIMHSVLNSVTFPEVMIQRLLQKNGVGVLCSVLQDNANNPDLCSAVIAFMNTLMNADTAITKQFGDTALWSSIISAMKCNPQHTKLAIIATETLQRLAFSNANYLSAMQKEGAVSIISDCMQCNPDSKELTHCGAAALSLLADKNDVSRALTVVLGFDSYDDVIITTSLGLLSNLALIEENAQFIVAKGGLNALMNLIHYKCKKKGDVSPQQVSLIANNIRAMARLLNDSINTQIFVQKGGLSLLKDIVHTYSQEESIINASMNALVHLVRNDSLTHACGDIVTEITNILYHNPEYVTLMQKYSEIVSVIPLNDKKILDKLLKGVQQSLLVNYNDEDTTLSIMNILKHIIMKDPTLVQHIMNADANAMIEAIKCNQNNPDTLCNILDAIHIIGKINPQYLNKIGLNDLLSSIGKEEVLSDETVAVIQRFLNDMKLDNIEYDLSNLIMSFKKVAVTEDEEHETEVKYDSEATVIKDNENEEQCTQYNTQTLMTKMRASRDPRIIIGTMKEISRRLQYGDNELLIGLLIHSGGIGDVLNQTNANIGNGAILNPVLDTMGILSRDQRLKQLLGMHGTIRLILQVMRRHCNDIELLDKCCYILSNLSFNNEQNMTAIIELGGVIDIVGLIEKHKSVNFLCESALNVFVNLCHNSDSNKALIAISGAAKVAIATLKLHKNCKNDGDSDLTVSIFKCLGNLAYISDNVKLLIGLDVVAHVLDTMNQNTEKKDLIEMGVVVLANLSSHDKSASRMIDLGVLDVIIRVSESYRDELEIQRSCLGCIGNLMNEESNAVTFLDKKGHLRVYEIMHELVFEESVIIIALKLLKILAINPHIATEMVFDGGSKIVLEIMEENKNTEEILSLAAQTLSKMIVTMESAQFVVNDGLANIMVHILKDNNNWGNIQIMNELIKVIVNITSIQVNAEIVAQNGSVPLLRGIEAHKTNAVFLNNAAMALIKMSSFPSSSKSLVKRGAVPVILTSIMNNPTRKAILTKYVRTLSNLMYTHSKTVQELTIHNGYKIVSDLTQKYTDYQPLQKEIKIFEKAMRGNAILIENNKLMKFLWRGTIIRKYTKNGKSKKKFLRLNDDCSLLIFEDINRQKAAKQLNVRSIKSVIQKKCMNDVDNTLNNCFVLISMDPKGIEFKMGIECKTNIEMQKWINGLQYVIQST